jgi:mannose-6-phosphate isomerase-like protein (cupin superfamily)
MLDGGEGESIAFPLHPTARLAGPDSNIAGMSFFEIAIPTGAPGAPPHTHSHEDEFFYVRQGTVTFMVNDERRTLQAGGFVLLPRHSLHAMWNTSDEDATLLVGTSAGKFGDFFDAVAMEVRAANASTPAEVGAIVGRLGAERGIVIDMTKVPEDVAALYGM